ncbi:MAG: restriction endonuclease [Candidatus Scalindua sp.]|nr:restriction endonuclease [Candidatus Scalindua sp.]
MKQSKGPQFIRFFIPIIEVLKELRGSGRPAEVTDLVIEKLNISEKEQEETIKSGSYRVRNQVAWARLYLVKSGLMDSSQRGVWSLTEQGLEATITKKDVLNYYKDIQSQLKIREEGSQEISNRNEEETIEFVDFKTELLNILKSLPPYGFERICQRLLRESGFLQVTGKSGDGGIDGHGILQVNPFVSFKVMFQCKRYQGAVTPSHVRDFRGAMEGRADKGIILTTGSFTTEAKKEARRDVATPIEIVDGEKLIEMFETLQLGLKPKTNYDVNYGFFSEYQ